MEIALSIFKELSGTLGGRVCDTHPERRSVRKMGMIFMNAF